MTASIEEGVVVTVVKTVAKGEAADEGANLNAPNMSTKSSLLAMGYLKYVGKRNSLPLRDRP